MHCTRSVWTCSWWSFHLYIVSRLLWSRFNKMKTKFTPENLALNVCCMVDICFRSAMATLSLNESGHQRSIGNWKCCTLTPFVILHQNQRTIRSRWVIEIRSKERHSFFFLEIHFSSPLVFLRWPEPIYMRVGYVFDLRFSEWKIQPISMMFGILNKQ